MNQKIYNNYIIETLDKGSLTSAAHSLGISQPALSNGIKTLEHKLNFKIFNRTLPITLTQEGELYFNYIKHQEILEQDFHNRLSNLRKKQHIHLIIGSPSAYVDLLIANPIYELLVTHPSYSATIKEAPLDELIELASHGKIHCFISTSKNLPDNFEKQFIYSETICLGIPRNIFPEDQELCATDFNGKNFIYLENQQPLQIAMVKYFEQNQITPLPRITVKQVSTAITLAKKGLGICFASEKFLKNTNLRIFHLPINPRPIYIAYDKELFIPNSALDFMNFLLNGGQS